MLVALLHYSTYDPPAQKVHYNYQKVCVKLIDTDHSLGNGSVGVYCVCQLVWVHIDNIPVLLTSTFLTYSESSGVDRL